MKIVAEIGINHNGQINFAKLMMEKAREAGCDYVKFQKRTPELCVPDAQKNIIRETPWGKMTYLDYKKHIEFGKDDYDIIDNDGTNWFASVWDEPAVDFIEENYNVPYYKIPSAMLTDTDLLERVADTGKPVILSTGMSTMKQIEAAFDICSSAPFVILMHSVSAYPLEDYDSNLNMIPALQKQFGCPVGYSDHTRGLHMACAAAALGACMIEKHITLDRAMWGTDQSASVETHALPLFVRNIRAVISGMGDGQKDGVIPCERPAYARLRKKI